MGEALLKDAIEKDSDIQLKSLKIMSAGTTTVDGMSASAYSVEALKRIGVDLSAHRSTMLTQELVDEAFAIFALAQSHIDVLQTYYDNLPSRVLTVLDAVEGCARHDVPDPYGGTIDDYLDVRDDIAYAIPSIVQYLKNELKKA